MDQILTVSKLKDNYSYIIGYQAEKQFCVLGKIDLFSWNPPKYKTREILPQRVHSILGIEYHQENLALLLVKWLVEQQGFNIIITNESKKSLKFFQSVLQTKTVEKFLVDVVSREDQHFLYSDSLYLPETLLKKQENQLLVIKKVVLLSESHPVKYWLISMLTRFKNLFLKNRENQGKNT